MFTGIESFGRDIHAGQEDFRPFESTGWYAGRADSCRFAWRNELWWKRVRLWIVFAFGRLGLFRMEVHEQAEKMSFYFVLCPICPRGRSTRLMFEVIPRGDGVVLDLRSPFWGDDVVKTGKAVASSGKDRPYGNT